MREIRGDILTDINEVIKEQQVIIIHACNCFHVMGSGLAGYLRRKYPVVSLIDNSQTKKGDRNKLGTFTKAEITPNFHILNCYTQYFYGRSNLQYTEYDAVEACFQRITEAYPVTTQIRMGRFGCGLGRGDWKIIQQLITQYFQHYDVTVYSK